ncbi:AKR_collapsed_G0005640.mRNA.1.CDS.1 [Saccharomyces cerevisiae]|nr:AKR_collapsed_G0005640.mRNA.1.CDS.1 [Saccharomyces cerevisiae]
MAASFVISKSLKSPENEPSSVKDYSFWESLREAAGVWEITNKVCVYREDCLGREKDALANNIK